MWAPWGPGASFLIASELVPSYRGLWALMYYECYFATCSLHLSLHYLYAVLFFCRLLPCHKMEKMYKSNGQMGLPMNNFWQSPTEGHGKFWKVEGNKR